MRIVGDNIQLSAYDLSNFISCRHLIWLELQAANQLIHPPAHYDPALIAFQERGLEFEKEYLENLRNSGVTISEPNDLETSIQRTSDAMHRGVDIIYQANLQLEEWIGRADFLRKVVKPSALGQWSYEVIDTKLAKETRTSTILQLCLYSEMLSKIQGSLPEFLYIIIPENGFTQHTYRVDDFMAYYRFVKRQLISKLAEGVDTETTYPNPVAHCDICRWWQYCNSRRRADDHLSLVAGLSTGQAKEIINWEVSTLAGLAVIPLPLTIKPERGAIESFERLVNQARVQFIARRDQNPVYELLELADNSGLSRLPKPSPGDVYLDFEGDPFYGGTGLEYLFGWVVEDSYLRIWAKNSEEERLAFQCFVDFIIERFEKYPDLHIYHFGSYETTALKRMMGKYAVRENEIDGMLRAGLFVDLHSIVKQSIRAGIESYSLKELEVFHTFARRIDLRIASSHLRVFETFLQRKQVDIVPTETLQTVEEYNKDDCYSTQSLHSWMEKLRITKISEGYGIPRPLFQGSQPSEGITAHQERIKPIYDSLMKGLPIAVKDRDVAQQAQWLQANMLDWYRREEKSVWWEYYRLKELTFEEALEDKSYVAGMKFTGQRWVVKRSVVDRYTFPVQDCDIKMKDKLEIPDGNGFGEVIAIDLVKGVIDVKKGEKIKDLHPLAVFVNDYVKAGVKEEAIIRIGQWIAENGINENGPFQAGIDLLTRTSPRENQLLGVLPIQGPPGAGKSHTAANMILELIKSKKKIGIVALSHKVIRNLLEKIVILAKRDHISIQCIHKVGSTIHEPNSSIRDTTDYAKVLGSLNSGESMIAAGTAWLWAREDFLNSVDVLFVDEAGQLSLIDTLAVSQAAPKIVLLGDPQQLKQPQKGTHPDGTEVSALEHILGEHKTIPVEKGIFLSETWRLHPKICVFISQIFYENRLSSKLELVNQLVSGNTNYNGAGLWFEPVEHEGNQSSSPEEAKKILDIVSDLIKGDVFWTNSSNEKRTINAQDVLIITPYNSQVLLLSSLLPDGMKIGTVDKFQGQEAPIVIFSLCSSSPDDAPRGMEFLYSPNRLNVAVSRARSVCILVGNPKLFQPDCKNPSQMKMANAFCRYLELAKFNAH